MNPINVLDRVFSDQKKTRILRRLASGQSRMTGREWARLLDISPATILSHLQDLVDEGIVIRTSVGSSNTFHLNERNEVVRRIVLPAFRTEKNIIPTVAKAFADHLSQKYIDSIVFYGSIARGTAKSGSDWDILILCKHTTAIEPLRNELDKLLPDFREQLTSTIDAKIFVTLDFCQRFHRGEPFPQNVFKDYLRSIVPNPLVGTALPELLALYGKKH